MDREDTVDQIMQRADELADQFTRDLDVFVGATVPKTLSNNEYAARTAALMISLSREIARCAVSFGETHQVDREEMVTLVGKMFGNHYARCVAAVDQGAGGLVH